MPVSPPQPSARPGHNTQQQTGSSLCREHDPLDPYSASASSMPSSGLQRKVTCCMYTACAAAASDEGLQHSDVNKGLDMHTVTVWGATCNEHRARSPPRRGVQQARRHTRHSKLSKSLCCCSGKCGRQATRAALKLLDQVQLAVQTRSREAVRADTPRICERIGVRVLSAPAAGCSHCLQRAAARHAGALLPSAACTLRI